ncbi:putative iron-sulfur flavoprotein [Selenomonas ruminantium subsp. lactilytica TAM6421]|uniref:Putative iron-sulfur flavoprotein n=2 Tax=Selenomonas ruminantium TaxID=971 RepID=I0GQB6_SELRL|nr:putative iron-sulfur flavoprotein [Selenomonas ruminantium subsp. lactilytica TAM6421]
MMSRIVVLVGSNRKGGNTDLLAKAFADGAREHHEVELISVTDYKVGPCLGCNSCFQKEGHPCFQQDDMQLIYDKLKEADILVVASPVYFYGLSAQLKAVIDRLHNPIRDTFKIRKLAMLLVGAATLPELFDAILAQYKLVLNFFKLEDGGTVLVRGAKEKGDVRQGNSLQQAFQLGKTIS